MFANTDKLGKVKHLIPVIPVYFIIITVSIGFTYYYTFDGEYSMLKYLTVPVFYYFASMVVICHTLSMFTSPGEVTSNIMGNKEERRNAKNHDPLYCNKCDVTRPERTHHCKVCQKCILKMDHHCPWVANCVGLNNQKYFYLFLFYATIGDFLAFLCLIFKLVSLSNSFKMNSKLTSVIEIFFDMREILFVALATVLAFAMTVAIGGLFIIQTNYILYNTTTIENKIYKSNEENPFSTGDKFENFKSVMGDGLLNWILPTKYISKSYNFKTSQLKTNSQGSYLSLSDMQEFDDNINIEIN